MRIDPQVLDEVRGGMADVVNQPDGTGHGAGSTA